MANIPVESTYSFSEIFRDNKNEEQVVNVILKINFIQKSWSIIPSHLKRDEFRFLNGTDNCYSKWKYLLICIDKANEFASKEIHKNESNLHSF